MNALEEMQTNGNPPIHRRNFALYSRCKLPGGLPMFTRREVMLGAVTAGTAALAWRPNEALASASQPSTPVNFAVPEGACDCHVHTFDPQHFPYSPSRPYTPEPVSVDELRSLHKALHIEPRDRRADDRLCHGQRRRAGRHEKTRRRAPAASRSLMRRLRIPRSTKWIAPEFAAFA